jgi:hypothetical protein
MNTYGHFIKGAYVDPVGGKSIDSFKLWRGVRLRPDRSYLTPPP